MRVYLLDDKALLLVLFLALLALCLFLPLCALVRPYIFLQSLFPFLKTTENEESKHIQTRTAEKKIRGDKERGNL